MNIIDSFYAELMLVLKVGLFLFFVLIAIVFVAACIYGLIDWINRNFFIHKFVIGKKEPEKKGLIDE